MPYKKATDPSSLIHYALTECDFNRSVAIHYNGPVTDFTILLEELSAKQKARGFFPLRLINSTRYYCKQEAVEDERVASQYRCDAPNCCFGRGGLPGSFDPKPIIEAATEILESEMNTAERIE